MPQDRRRKYTLPRDAILRGKKNFEVLFNTGKTMRGKCLNLKYRIFESTGADCKMAFVVGKRLGKAARRNKVKRQMREAYRKNKYLLDHFGQLSKPLSFHGALMAKSVNNSYHCIEDDIITFLNRLSSEQTSKNDP